tara:strand:+ start:173 stop:589 length:417 start_codon:yes stop_codon:yes gene_type:complete
MSEQTKIVLKSYFETGDVPTQVQFANQIDSFGLQSEVDANTAKTGITTAQANEIVANNAKVTYDAAAAVALNTAKVSFDSASSTKLGTIAENAAVNTINTTVTGEPTGSDLVPNIVSLTQAEYDAGTAVAGTFYAIVG